MRRKLYKSRRGQISTEIMYAVGVMIMIFLLLTGISFNRRSELRKMDDYLQKRNECLKISNTLASLTSAGFNTRAVVTVYNKVWIFNTGRITVDPSLSGSEETPCTFVGNIDTRQFTAGQDYLELTGDGRPYCFFNTNEKISIYDVDDVVTILVGGFPVPINCIDLCAITDSYLLSLGLQACA
ncbi:hypothetical protein J4208_05310 [Candidatus Woesearchaeota archaeon]|nr:hypothetical protein [Candidatus Woesearchaeota archaeon]